MGHLYDAECGVWLLPCCICGRAPAIRRMRFPKRTLIQCRRKTRRTMHVVATYYADPATAAREWNRRNERPDAVLRAALARETERAEKAERLAERLKQEAIFHAGEARAQRATVHEAAQIASGASGEKADWNGAVPVRELLDRAVRAESERDRLRESLKSEQAWAKEYHDEWQKAELAARNAVGHADSLRQGAINWRERAWTAERKLAALSHLGAGTGRRAE